eukprot:2511090-Pyramimonas_sp.AAC.1
MESSEHRRTLSRHLSTPPLLRVDSLQTLFGWVDHSIQFAAWATQTTAAEVRRQLSDTFTGFTISTAFSGIGAPEMALQSIMKYLNVPERSNTLFAIEWDQECRRELALIPNGPRCLFSDINDFWDSSLDIQDWWTLTDYEQAIVTGNSIQRSGVWCGLHNCYSCVIRSANCAIGGTPCPDWSSQGSGGGVDGSDLMATMCWVAMRWELEEDMFINENVQRFPPELILACLAAKYVIQSVVCRLTDQGWPHRRSRRITVGIHKRRIIAGMDWTMFSGSFRRELRVSWRVVLQDNQAEIAKELEWARSRPSS